MKKLHILLMLLLAFTAYACTNDDDPGMSSSRGESDGKSIISWDIVEGVQVSAELHEDLAYVIIKGENYWYFKQKMEERGIEVVVPYSYLNPLGAGVGPFKNAVKVILGTNYHELLGEEEVIYAGPSVTGIDWSAGDLIRRDENGDTISIGKFEDRPGRDPIAQSQLDGMISPIINYVTGVCAPGKEDQLEAFIKENNLISEDLRAIHVTKESRYDVLSLIKILNQRFGSYFLRTVSNPLHFIQPAIVIPNNDEAWWRPNVDEPIFGRYLSAEVITPLQISKPGDPEFNYLYQLHRTTLDMNDTELITPLVAELKEGVTISVNQHGKYLDVIDKDGNHLSVLEWYGMYNQYRTDHPEAKGYEYDPAEFYHW